MKYIQVHVKNSDDEIENRYVNIDQIVYFGMKFITFVDDMYLNVEETEIQLLALINKELD